MATHQHGRMDDDLARLAPVTRCRATSRAGTQCKQPAIPGGQVCRFHGGSAPQVREAARRRLLGLVPSALDTLVSMLEAESEAVRVKAAIDLLDRAGMKHAEELTLVPQEETNAALDARIATALARRAQSNVDGQVLDVDSEEPAAGTSAHEDAHELPPSPAQSPGPVDS